MSAKNTSELKSDPRSYELKQLQITPRNNSEGFETKFIKETAKNGGKKRKIGKNRKKLD